MNYPLFRKTAACLLGATFVVILNACQSKKAAQDDDGGQEQALVSDKPTEVRVKCIHREVFHYELVSNGQVRTNRKAELRFEMQEIITKIFVRNGQRVHKGQKLASMESFKLQSALEQAKDNFERARLELQDILIGQGYTLAESAAIPEKVMKIAKVKSNYEQSRIGLQTAEYNLKNASLYAPFDGVVANLFTQENNYPSSSSAFCTVVDLDHPQVQFQILESEASLVKKGDEVLVTPFSTASEVIRGIVDEINPMVDQNGMITVRASLKKGGQTLYEGVNVRVRVQRSTDKQLLIPKRALVLRNNRKVVFTCKGGLAQWVYVQTGLENSESYVVTDGLQEGDSVIYEGNLNLAHESPVVVR